MTYVSIAAAALLGGIVQPLTGFGAGVILMVVAQYFYVMTIAPSIVAAICLFQSGIMAYQYRKKIDFKQIAPLILFYTGCSLIVINLLGNFDLHVLTACFGAFLLLLAVYFLFVAPKVALKPGAASGVICSAFSGCCAGAFAVGGPMMALYFVTIARDKDTYVANMQFLFFVTNTVNVIMRAFKGLYGMQYVPVTAVGVVFVLLGVFIGTILSKKMSGDVARQMVYIGVGISGLVTLLQQIL